MYTYKTEICGLNKSFVVYFTFILNWEVALLLLTGALYNLEAEIVPSLIKHENTS